MRLVLALCLLGALPFGHAVGPQPAKHDERLIGWSGETFKPRDPFTFNKAGRPSYGTIRGPARVEQVSWKPRAYLYHNFMTDEECRHLAKLAAPTMKRSSVVGPNGTSVLDDYRTSYGTFLSRNQDPVVEAVENRTAEWVQIPPENAEDMQVLRYDIGQQYKVHMDSLKDPVAGPRVATVLLYFNDVKEGGETAFPDSPHWVDSRMPKVHGPFSPCAPGGVQAKPRRGDAFLFWSFAPDATSEDPNSMHTGCPVVKGVKWTGTKWFHPKPFRPETFARGSRGDRAEADPGWCKDTHKRCKEWAEGGECQKNSRYMVGDTDGAGSCRAACKVCEPCAGPNDLACYNRNRASANFLVFDPAELEAEEPQ